MSQLHFSLSPQSRPDKELLTFGYVRLNYIDSMPIDIVKLCQSFYDEALVWNIDCIQLSIFAKKSTGSTIKYNDKWFYCQGIKMRWTLDPIAASYSHYSSKVISLYLQIATAKIDAVKLYISIFCPQNGATFKRVIDKTHFSQYTDINNKLTLISTSFGMILDYQQFANINFNHYIDVLSFIECENGRKYLKAIAMNKQCNISWNIDGLLLSRMKTAFCQQMFYSELFDVVNNNWCLCLYPMGQTFNAQQQDRIVGVVLRLFKIGSNISSLKVKLSITNSYNQKQEEKEVEFDSACGFDELFRHIKIDLFSSAVLLRLDSISIVARVEVMAVNGDSDAGKWTEFGIV